MFGDDPNAAAQEIADAMKAADFERAFSLLGRFTGDEQKQVADQAVALGADPTIIASMLQTFGSGETIIISASGGASIRIWPRWPLFVVAALGLAAGAYIQAWRRRA